MNLYISNQDIVSLDISEINELDYYSSKLCFIDHCIEDCKNSVNIRYGDSLYYDKKRDIYYLPVDIDEYQRCFLYRVVMDCIQVKRGNLPIHAAAVTCGINTVIIAAKPGRGKSYIADCICNSNSGCSVVGDDHIIISKNHIQGNKKRRMRNIHGKSIAYLNNTGIIKLQNIIFTCFELSSDENEMKFLSGSEAIQYFSEATAFKYLNEIFVHNGRSYGPNIFADLNGDYKRIFCNFIEKHKVLSIRGSLPYAADIISRLMK